MIIQKKTFLGERERFPFGVFHREWREKEIFKGCAGDRNVGTKFGGHWSGLGCNTVDTSVDHI